MAEFFNWLVQLFLNVPVEVYVLVLGAAGVSLLSQVFKKWFKIENEKWMFGIVLGIAALGSFLDWFLTSNTLPPTVIGLQTSILVGIAQPVYFYVIKPLNNVITIYKANKEAIKAKLAEVEVAKIPKEVKTLEDAQVVVDKVKAAAKAAAPALTPEATTTPTLPNSTPVEGAIAFEETPATPEVPRPVADF